MSFRRSYGTGSYGGSSLLPGGYSSRGYSGYASTISPTPYSSYSNNYNSSTSGSSPNGYSSVSYTPSTSYLNASTTLPSSSTRLGRSSSLRSKSVPRDQPPRRDRSLQRYTSTYSSNNYTPSYSSGYTNSYQATRNLINKVRSKSISDSAQQEKSPTPTLSAASSGYGGSCVRIQLIILKW